MNMKLYLKKIMIVILSIVIVLFALSGSYARYNIDKLAYVIGLGLDVGETSPLKVSIQLSKPQGGSGGSSSGSAENIVNSIECSSINSAINLFNSYISRKLTLSHCKVIVISEELAATGISDYIYTLANDVNVSPHANIIISKSPAKDFLDSSEPVLEDLASKYYEIALNSSEYTGYTQNVTLIKFFSDYIDTFKSPVAILGSVSSSSAPSSSNSSSSSNNASNSSNDDVSSDDINIDNSRKAGETSITSKSNIENMGIAIFNKDKLVGELNGIENIYHLIVSSQLKSCNISIPNPLGSTSSIDINLKLSKSTKNKVSFINGTPYISVKVSAKIKILSTTEDSTIEGSKYYTKENIKLIEDECSKYLQESISKYLYKTAKDFKSDIDGFGKYAVKYFLTSQDWETYNWLNNYEKSIFDVDVKTSLKSGYAFL